MFNHGFVVAQLSYPDAIVVNVSGENEVASLTQVAQDGAIYKTEGCLTYYMDTKGEIYPVMS